MAPVQPTVLQLIGMPVLHSPAGALHFVAERPFQLMAWLAHQADWVPRERLAGLFWPEHGAEAARRNLRKVLFRLRETAGLPIPDELGGALRWPVPTDLQAIDRAIEAGDASAAAQAWPHEPFDGLDGGGAFDAWLAVERRRLRSRWRLALLARSADAAPALALAWTGLLLDADPLDEAALQVRLHALQRADRGAEAGALYRDYERHLAQELDARPSAGLRAWAAAHAGREAPADPTTAARLPLAAAPRPGRSEPAAVPLAPVGDRDTALVGRQVERRALHAWHADPSARWLTLTGPGGIGKSTLARAVSAAWAEAVEVQLEGLPDAAAVPGGVASALGLPGSAAGWPALAQALAVRPRLLLLDNLEPFLDVVPALQRLLADATGLRLLVTSREPCQVPGERVVTLAGLPYPEPEDVERAEQFDAVQLFVRAARAQRDGFRLPPEPAPERAAVVRLCAWLEGWPLALELAAAWVRHRTLGEIVQALQDGQRDVLAPPPGHRRARHASFDAALAPSLARLSPLERDTLERLAMLDAAFDAETAQSVAPAGTPGLWARLAALVDRSLLRVEATPQGTRWSMHELVRRPLRQALRADAARHAVVRDALSEGWAHRAAQRLADSTHALPPQAVAAAMDELPGLRQAWAIAFEDRRADRLARLHPLLFRLLSHRGEWGPAFELLQAAEPLLEGAARARLAASLAYLQVYGGQPAAAAARAREALRAGRRHRDAAAVMQALWVVGQAAWGEGRLPVAQRCFAEGRELAGQRGSVDAEVAFIDGLSGVCYARGQHDEQRAWLERGIALALQHGLKPLVSLSNLGNAWRASGRPVQALAAFDRGLALAAASPGLYRRERATLLCNRGLLLGDLGRVDEALQAARDGLAAAGDGVDPVMALYLGGLLGGLLRARGDLAGSREALREALAGARRVGRLHAQLWLLLEWARWQHAAGHVDDAATTLDVVLASAGLSEVERNDAQGLRASWSALAKAAGAPTRSAGGPSPAAGETTGAPLAGPLVPTPAAAIDALLLEA